jgi:predicted Zn-dependent protease with MMP-like domain
MDKNRFEELVAQAVESLPEDFGDRLENIDIVVSDEPSRTQMRQSGLKRNETLLGLYEGIPQTERGCH